MAEPLKDTIYIDAEDDITTIIDKVQASKAKIVALVLPKRSSTLQSVVNLKLLKRSSTTAKKSLVLITTDPNLLPLAGAVGLHVAKTLQTKPVIPAGPLEVHSSDDIPDNTSDLSTPVGQLAGHVATEDTIELDNEAAVEEVAAAGGVADKKSLNKKLRVPDFDRFRVLLFGGIALLILLIVSGVFALVVLPKAKITIKTDTTTVNTDLRITAKTAATLIDEKALILPATSKELKKTDKEKVPATGQRDEGTKATGTVTVTNCNKDGDAVSLPAGTTLTTIASGASLSFVTTEATAIAQSNFKGDGTCKNDSFKNVTVTAGGAGGQYNLSAHRTFSTGISGVTGTDSSAMTGGTSKLVQIISQKDVDNAKQKILDRLNVTSAGELKDQFTANGFVALTDTFGTGTPVVTNVPNVNDPSADVTVTVAVIYTELGVKKADLKQLVEKDARQHIDATRQIIQDNGIDKATILVTDKKSATEVVFQFKTLVVAGPQLDGEGIKKEIAGQKKSDTQRIISSRPGIKDVNISYSPFWVYSTPKKTSHITVIFDQNNGGQ